MRALRVILIALLTAVAGAVLSVVASLYLTELYHVSNFEGGRGMLIFFAIAPLGLIVGFIIGLIVALRSRGTGFGGFAKAQGIALGIAIGLALLAKTLRRGSWRRAVIAGIGGGLSIFVCYVLAFWITDRLLE